MHTSANPALHCMSTSSPSPAPTEADDEALFTDPKNFTACEPPPLPIRALDGARVAHTVPGTVALVVEVFELQDTGICRTAAGGVEEQLAGCSARRSCDRCRAACHRCPLAECDGGEDEASDEDGETVRHDEDRDQSECACAPLN